MKLTNWSLAADYHSTEVTSSGRLWDLHNALAFVDLRLEAANNTITMLWRTRASLTGGLMLKFWGVVQLWVRNRDERMPLTEDDCIASISKSNNTGEQDKVAHLMAGETNTLLFTFQSGRAIEIQAESVELLALD